MPETQNEKITRIDTAQTLAATAAGMRTIWEFARIIVFLGGFLVMFFRVGDWWGESRTSLRTITELVQSMNTKIDNLIRSDAEQETRIIILERQLGVIPPAHRTLPAPAPSSHLFDPPAGAP